MFFNIKLPDLFRQSLTIGQLITRTYPYLHLQCFTENDFTLLSIVIISKSFWFLELFIKKIGWKYLFSHHLVTLSTTTHPFDSYPKYISKLQKTQTAIPQLILITNSAMYKVEVLQEVLRPSSHYCSNCKKSYFVGSSFAS